MDVIVTRHKALIEYLLEEGIVDKDNYKVITHATPEEISGKHVFGVLPHGLSCLTASFTEIPLFLPLEMRGKELTKEDIYEYAGEPSTYIVKKL